MESHKHGTKSPTNARDPPNMVGMDIVWEGQRTRSMPKSELGPGRVWVASSPRRKSRGDSDRGYAHTR